MKKSKVWEDKEFLLWAFNKREISITLSNFEICMDKLHECYRHLQDGTIRHRYLMDMVEKKLNKLEDK